jgi:hypothetical protein
MRGNGWLKTITWYGRESELLSFAFLQMCLPRNVGVSNTVKSIECLFRQGGTSGGGSKESTKKRISNNESSCFFIPHHRCTINEQSNKFNEPNYSNEFTQPINSIFNFRQEQSPGRGGCTGVAAIFGFQDVFKFGGCDFAKPDIHQGTDNISYHIF